MTALPANSETSFVPTDIIIPENKDELAYFLDDTFKRIIDALNDKDIGHYNTVELLNGQLWFDPDDAQEFKRAYRKVIDFGALPNTATKTIAHGITTNANTTFTRIYGTATDPAGAAINSAIPLPYCDPGALANSILLSIDATNVTITTGANYAAYTTCYVVLDYLQY